MLRCLLQVFAAWRFESIFPFDMFASSFRLTVSIHSPLWMVVQLQSFSLGSIWSHYFTSRYRYIFWYKKVMLVYVVTMKLKRNNIDILERYWNASAAVRVCSQVKYFHSHRHHPPLWGRPVIKFTKEKEHTFLSKKNEKKNKIIWLTNKNLLCVASEHKKTKDWSQKILQQQAGESSIHWSIHRLGAAESPWEQSRLSYCEVIEWLDLIIESATPRFFLVQFICQSLLVFHWEQCDDDDDEDEKAVDWLFVTTVQVALELSALSLSLPSASDSARWKHTVWPSLEIFSFK